jgi:hypothetical protein
MSDVRSSHRPAEPKPLTPTQKAVREMYPNGRYVPESERTAATQALAAHLATERGDELVAYRRVDARFDLAVVLLRDATGAFALAVVDENRQTISDVQPLELATASAATERGAELGHAFDRRHAFERVLRGLRAS